MNKEKFINILKNAAAIIVIIAMFIIIFYQSRDRDLFKFGKDESSDIIASSQNGSSDDTTEKSDVRIMGDDVAFLTTTSYSLLDKNAEGKSNSISLSEPVLHTEESFAVCYNKNSLEATVYKKDREYYKITTENRIISAKVNKNGYLFTATEKEGYNCECRVYNRSGEAIFRWDISKSEFLDGDINCNNNTMVISVATAGEKKLLGEVILIDITDAEIIKKQSFDSMLFFGVDFNKNDTYTAFGSSALVYFNSDGTQKWSYAFEDRKLLKADISDPDMMVMAFSAKGSEIKGSSTDVKVINRLGKVIAEKTYDGTMDSLSLSDSAIAMAFGKTIYVTDSSLKEKKTLESEFAVKKIALYNDNKHLFVIGNSGSKIIE